MSFTPGPATELTQSCRRHCCCSYLAALLLSNALHVATLRLLLLGAAFWFGIGGLLVPRHHVQSMVVYPTALSGYTITAASHSFTFSAVTFDTAAIQDIAFRYPLLVPRVTTSR